MQKGERKAPAKFELFRLLTPSIVVKKEEKDRVSSESIADAVRGSFIPVCFHPSRARS